MPIEKQNWELEFDEQFELRKVAGDRTFKDYCEYLYPDIKGFIKILLLEREKELSVNIGMLRQWLNEDRIDDPNKMVTNEQVQQWLQLLALDEK